MIKKLTMLAVLLTTLPVLADWVESPNSTVNEIWEWNNNKPIYFRTSLGKTCWIPQDEKNIYSLILSLYISGRKANFHCFPQQTLVTGGLTGYRLHRVVAKK